MGLDIRLPMGLMFGVLGVVLVIWGLITHSNSDLYVRSLGVNVNLWWGLVMVAFGGTMLLLSWRAARKIPLGTETATNPDVPRPSPPQPH